MRALPFVVLLLLTACTHTGAPPAGPTACAPELVREEAQAMGTLISFAAYSCEASAARHAFAAAFAEIHRLEALMTTWPHPYWPPSDVMAINAAAGAHPVAVSTETFEVLRAAQAMAQLSDGVFDVTFAPLGDLWHFDEDLRPEVPSASAVARQRTLINYRDLALTDSNQQVFLHRPGMRINLGGIAKGYIVDAAVRVLRAAGLTDFMLQAGGDLYLAGSKGGAPWRVGIRDPRAADGAPFAVAAISDHAFSTAGDYERAFERGGKRYHHILDPRTGYPASACRSVTVFAPSALLADALDDVIFILGPEAGLALMQKAFPDAGAVVVDAANQVHISESLRSVVTVLHQPSP